MNDPIKLTPEQQTHAQLHVLDKMRGEIQKLCDNLPESSHLRDTYLANIESAKKAVLAGNPENIYEFLAVYRGVIIMAYNFHDAKCDRLALMALTHGLACFADDLARQLDQDFTGSAVEMGDQYGKGKAHLQGS